VRDGLIQHWGTVHGDVMSEIEALFTMAGIPLHRYS